MLFWVLLLTVFYLWSLRARLPPSPHPRMPFIYPMLRRAHQNAAHLFSVWEHTEYPMFRSKPLQVHSTPVYCTHQVHILRLQRLLCSRYGWSTIYGGIRICASDRTRTIPGLRVVCEIPRGLGFRLSTLFAFLPTEDLRKPLYDTVRHCVLGFLQGRNPWNDKFRPTETLVNMTNRVI